MVGVLLLAAALFGVDYFNQADESFSVFKEFVTSAFFWVIGGVFCVINGAREVFSRER